MVIDIHNLKVRYERALAQFKDSPVSQNNKNLVLRFHDFLISDGIGYSKIERYLYDLKKLNNLLGKDFVSADLGCDWDAEGRDSSLGVRAEGASRA